MATVTIIEHILREKKGGEGKKKLQILLLLVYSIPLSSDDYILLHVACPLWTHAHTKKDFLYLLTKFTFDKMKKKTPK